MNEDTTYYVFREAFDDDKTLFVGRASAGVPRNRHVVFTGTERECRWYVHENQGKAATPGLKKILPPEIR